MELEKDVQTAASLGKALLDRHEKSLLEGTQERSKLRHAIEELEGRNVNLEMENHSLEVENQKTIEENRRLLVQLEEYNQGMSMNEIKAREMQGDLDALHEELARVATAAARTEILEAQLQALESEQTEMKKTITRTKEDERAAVARWKQAERIIVDLTAEVERIEREHRMEKARAQNLMDRLEKRQIGDRKTGTFPSALVERTAMSQFMRDILAENNHLQSALSELRDMLLTSQEEVGALREQLMELGRVEGTRTPTPLSRELPANAGSLPVVPPVPELHFHHHVHKEKVIPRRVKRKGRAPLALDPSRRSMTTPDIESTPTTPGSARLQRWSQLSGHTRSSSGRGLLSFPGSPQSVSTFRDPSIFDRDYGVDSTRPSTADTEWDSVSVQKFGDRSRRRPRDSIGGPPFSILYTEEIPENLAEDESCDDVDERGDTDNLVRGSANVHTGGQSELNGPLTDTRPPSSGGRSILRKSASHESLLVPASQMYRHSASTASFNPASPAAIAAAAASKDQAMSAHNRTCSGASSAAYNHLHLLAGGNIRGKGPARGNTSGSSRNGWFGGWGWGATPFGANFRVTAPSEDSETEGSSVATPMSGGRSPAVSIASFRSKSTPAEAVLAGEMVSAGTSPARSVQSVRSAKSSGGVPAASKPVPIAVYRSMVDEQFLRESIMESMQM